MRAATILATVALLLLGAAPNGSGTGATSVPVLLVPGWSNTGRDLEALRLRLVSAGWPAGRVDALTFRDPVGSNRAHAAEIDSAAAALLSRTSADRLDIVAHSMGGLATRYALAEPGAPAVRRVVFLATPQRGTWAAYLAWGEGAGEMRPGSAFLDTLNAAPPVPAGVRALTIRSLLDMHVLPEESGVLPGVPDRVVCCPTHEGLVRDMDTFRAIRGFLADGETP